MNLKNQIIEYIENTQYKEASHLLEEYKDSFGIDDFYYLAVSDILLGNQEYEEVLDLMAEAISVGYEHPVFYERIADAHIGLQEWDEALTWLKKCETSDEEDPDGDLHRLFLLGKIYIGKNDFKKAVSYFEDILLETDDPEIYFLAACCYWELGNKKRVFEYFDQIKSDTTLLEQICQFLFEEVDQALIQYAEELPESSQKVFYKAMYFNKYESAKKAIEFLGKNITKYPSTSLFNLIVQLYDEQNQNHQANIYRKKMLKLTKTSEEDPYTYISIYLDALFKLNYSYPTEKKYISFLWDQFERSLYKLFILYSLDENSRFDLNFSLFKKFTYKELESTEEVQPYFLLFTRAAYQTRHFNEAYTGFKSIMPFQEKDELIDFVLTCFHTYHYYDILDCTKDNYKTDGILAGVRFMCLDILSKTDEMIDLVDTMNEAIKNNEPIEDLDFYLDILKQREQ
ncbi:tetratricopeptide repeat protein [Dubosiella newyorkensis]|uniref:tetratricopeptide repeat protein n=1 Tax=Dubosiella newyorkensis TaxID=1862672 RepID=UPI00248C65D8|nr:hypothetical protein [Dubosiella newyorkensis]